jgi:hypothetical protein
MSILEVFSVFVALCQITSTVPINECNTGFVLPGTTIQCKDNVTGQENDYEGFPYIEYYDNDEDNVDTDISLRSVFEAFAGSAGPEPCTGSIRFVGGSGEQVGEPISKHVKFLRKVKGVERVRKDGNCCFQIGSKMKMRGLTQKLVRGSDFVIRFSTVRSVQKIHCQTEEKCDCVNCMSCGEDVVAEESQSEEVEDGETTVNLPSGITITGIFGYHGEPLAENNYTVHYSNGRTWAGPLDNLEATGYGTLTLENENTITGEFVDGNIVPGSNYSYVVKQDELDEVWIGSHTQAVSPTGAVLFYKNDTMS